MTYRKSCVNWSNLFAWFEYRVIPFSCDREAGVGAPNGTQRESRVTGSSAHIKQRMAKGFLDADPRYRTEPKQLRADLAPRSFRSFMILV